jgi:hypothetical protein
MQAVRFIFLETWDVVLRICDPRGRIVFLPIEETSHLALGPQAMA